MGRWGFDGCCRSGAAQGTGLMEARDGLVGRELATGVAQRVVSGAQARWCRCDRRPEPWDRTDEGGIGLSAAASGCGGLAL